MKTLSLLDGTPVPVLGQGTWKMGENPANAQAEVDALRLGIDLGLTLLDTAEMYADGRSEGIVARAMAGQRDRVFLVTKVYPHNAGRQSLPAACERSLRRLGTDVIDLYLLHWRGSIPLAETVAAFETLRAQGKIRRWGVSNFDVDDLDDLGPTLADCATDQILYNPEYRGPEFDLLPWSQGRRLPLMAYSPVGQGGRLLQHRALAGVAARHGATPAQVSLAWVLRQENVLAIPKASDPVHVRANAAALDLQLTAEDFAVLDAAFPPPGAKSRSPCFRDCSIRKPFSLLGQPCAKTRGIERPNRRSLPGSGIHCDAKVGSNRHIHRVPSLEVTLLGGLKVPAVRFEGQLETGFTALCHGNFPPGTWRNGTQRRGEASACHHHVGQSRRRTIVDGDGGLA